MVVGPGVDPVDATSTGPTAITSTADRHARFWWRNRHANLVVLAVLAAIAVAVAVTARPAGLPTADLVGGRGLDLPDAPAAAVVRRWTLDLAPGDGVALVDERVVVVGRSSPPDGRVPVTARHVVSKAMLWERSVPQHSLVLLVDGDGTTTTVHGTREAVEQDDPRLVAMGADDGRVLWERGMAWDMGASAGHVLLATATGCELVDTRSGRTSWEEGTQACFWLDDDEVMASRRGRWEVHGLDGTVAGAPLPGTDPPAAVGQYLAAVDGDELVLLDRAGDERWRTPLTGAEARGPLGPVGLPGVGVVVAGWDEDAGEQLAAAFDLDGNRLDRDAEFLAVAQVVDVDGRMLVLTEDWGDDGQVTMATRPVDNLDRALASLAFPQTQFRVVVTSQGVLTPTATGDRIDLRRWPDLVPAWSVDLSTVVGEHGGWGEVLTSDIGMVVLSPGNHRLHAFG